LIRKLADRIPLRFEGLLRATIGVEPALLRRGKDLARADA
jgi:hypothetical protein